MPLINCKIHLELNSTKNYVMSDIAGNTKLYIPIVTLSNKDKVKLRKQQDKGFKTPVYWSEYKTKIESKDADNNNAIRIYLNASF